MGDLTLPVATLCFGAWMLLGAIVVESCRIWKAWWLKADLFTMAVWPLVLFLTIRSKP